MDQPTTEFTPDSVVPAAVGVLKRAVSWLLKDQNLAGARYVEPTLGRWAVQLGETEQQLLAAIDAAELAERRDRLSRLLVLLSDRGEPATPVLEPRARLLPEDVAALPRRKAEPTPPVETAPEPALVEAAPAQEVAQSSERRRPTREERRAERDAERQRRRERRADQEKVAEKPAEVAPPEPVVVEPVKVEPPPPPPPVVEEPRSFPLGHPEGTGATLSVLSDLSEEELAAFTAAGILTVADLLGRAPVSQDRAGERWVPASLDGQVIVRGVVRSRCLRFGPAGRRFELGLTTDRGTVVARWIGVPDAEVSSLRPGVELGLCGRLEVIEDQHLLYEAELLGIDGRGGDWLPRYEVAGLPESRVRSLMRAALRRYSELLVDHLPADLLERYKLLPLGVALRDAHFPANTSRRGRLRLAFDEMLQVQLGIMLQQGRAQGQRGAVHPVVHGLLARALAMGGWTLTDSQESAFDEIRRDLRRPQPMMRLLQGDVGTGKQQVIQAAMVITAEAQFQGLFLAPDALTAEHRYLFAEGFYKSIGLEPVLLSNPPSRAQVEALRRGEGLVVYGTHAAASVIPECKRLGLVVVEDPGPTGFFDAAVFDALPHRPDVLTFTSMPVPTPVLLSVYGSLALTTLPSSISRGADTVVVEPDQRDTAYAAAREVIALGQQVMIVLPLKRGQDLLSLSEIRGLAQRLSADFLAGAKVNIFHGAMSREERFRAYDDFQHRRADVLLATTFIEHGPTVPNVSVLLIESAEHFDGIRLHRLRAHVTNGWWRGRVLLVTGAEAPPEGRPAVDLIARETDGYRIAATELKRLGIEATVGERPEEMVEFYWGDPGGERDLFLRTRQEAVRILAADPGLKRRNQRPLLYLVRARFGEEFGGDAPPPGPEKSEGGRRKRRRRR